MNGVVRSNRVSRGVSVLFSGLFSARGGNDCACAKSDAKTTARRNCQRQNESDRPQLRVERQTGAMARRCQGIRSESKCDARKKRLLHAQLLDAGALRNAHGCAGALSAGKNNAGEDSGGEIFRAGGDCGRPKPGRTQCGLSIDGETNRRVGREAR